MDEVVTSDNRILKAFEAIQNENQKLQSTLQEILGIRKSLELSLDSADNQLSTFFQEEQKLQSTHAINLMKIQNVEKGVNQLGEKLKVLTENVQMENRKIKEYKQNLDSKINNFTKGAEHLGELFLSAVHNGTAESECLKIFDEINKLKLEIEKKEETLLKIQRELEEFVFFEADEKPPEFSVTLEERQALMNLMENQYMFAMRQLDELNRIKSEKQCEDFHLKQENGISL